MALKTSGLKTLRWNNSLRLFWLNAFAILTEIFIWVFYALAIVVPVYLLLPEDYEAQKILAPVLMAPVIIRAGFMTPITRMFSLRPYEILTVLRANEVILNGGDEKYRILEELCILTGIKTPQIFVISNMSKQITIASLKIKRRHYCLLVSRQALDLPIDELRCLFAYEIGRIVSKDSDYQLQMLTTFISFEETLKIHKEIRNGVPYFAYPFYLLVLPLVLFLAGYARCFRMLHKSATGVDQDVAGFELTKDVDATVSLYEKVIRNAPVVAVMFPGVETFHPLFFALFLEEENENYARKDLERRANVLQKTIKYNK